MFAIFRALFFKCSFCYHRNLENSEVLHRCRGYHMQHTPAFGLQNCSFMWNTAWCILQQRFQNLIVQIITWNLKKGTFWLSSSVWCHRHGSQSHWSQAPSGACDCSLNSKVVQQHSSEHVRPRSVTK